MRAHLCRGCANVYRSDPWERGCKGKVLANSHATLIWAHGGVCRDTSLPGGLNIQKMHYIHWLWKTAGPVVSSWWAAWGEAGSLTCPTALQTTREGSDGDIISEQYLQLVPAVSRAELEAGQDGSLERAAVEHQFTMGLKPALEGEWAQWLLPSKPPLEDPGEPQSPEKVHYWTAEVCNTSAWITQLLISVFTAKPQKSSGQHTRSFTWSSAFRNRRVVMEFIPGRAVAGNQWILWDGELNLFILLSE